MLLCYEWQILRAADVNSMPKVFKQGCKIVGGYRVKVNGLLEAGQTPLTWEQVMLYVCICQ